MLYELSESILLNVVSVVADKTSAPHSFLPLLKDTDLKGLKKYPKGRQNVCLF